MLRSILQNSTAGFYIFASDSATPTSGKTGLTITTTLSKVGGTTNSVSPTITEIGNGLYWVAPIAAHRDTLGEIAWQFSGTGAIIAPRLEKVVAVNDQTARFGASDGTSVTLAENQDVRNVGGTLPAVTLAASQPNYAPLTTLGTNAPAGWLNAAAFAAGSLNGKGDWSTADALTTVSSTLQSMITALNNLSAKANWFGSLLLEIPDSGTRAYLFELVVRDDEDKLTNLDGLPTIALTNTAGTDRSSLITTGIANPSTGRYTLTISVETSTTNEALKLTATGTISGETRYAVITPQVVDYDAATLINAIYNRIGAPAGASIAADIATRLASASYTAPDNAGISSAASSAASAASTASTINTKIGAPSVSVAADIASVKLDTGTTIPGLFTTLTTKVRKFLQLLVRKDSAIATDNATELSELNANGGSGAGSFNQSTDSLEAIRDRGDAAWTTGAGGGGGDVQISSEAVVVARLPIGATVGWPQTLMIGNAYLQATQTAPKLFVKDIDDNILTALGEKNFDAADFVATLRLSPLTTGQNGTVDDNQPATTIEITSDDEVGIVYDDSTADSEFFWLQIPRAKSLLGDINTRYSAQFIMNWGEDETYEFGINLGDIKFHRKNAAAT